MRNAIPIVPSIAAAAAMGDSHVHVAAADRAAADVDVGADATTNPPDTSDDFDPRKLRVALLASFGKLVLSACRRAAQAQEQSTFRDDQDSKQTLALVRLAPGLLKLLDEQEKQTALEAPVARAANGASSETEAQAKDCPECFICSAPPGAHWAHECPVVHRDDERSMVFDYKTHSVYERKDIGLPMPRALVGIEQYVSDWLERNRLIDEHYAVQVNIKRMKEEAERLVLVADSASACAKRGDPINTQVAADIAKYIAEQTLEMLRHCNDRFNPFLPDSLTPATALMPSRENSDETRSEFRDDDTRDDRNTCDADDRARGDNNDDPSDPQ